jgi:ketosteroid isomerase-like protein
MSALQDSRKLGLKHPGQGGFAVHRPEAASLPAAKSVLISWRRCRTPEDMSDKSAILAANAAFYAAFATGDVGDMATVWAEDDNVSCIHPGWPAIVGRLAVLGSWRDILSGRGRPHITCHEPHAIVTGDSGYVLCIELMGSAAFAASNHFRQIDGVWRLSHHQASPISPNVGQGDDDPSPKPSTKFH